MSLQVDLNAALEFLGLFHPSDPWALTAIQVDRFAIDTAVFNPTQGANEAREWLHRTAAPRNVYFHVNRVRVDLDRKAKKSDVEAVTYFHVDVDPEPGKDLEEEQARILGLFTDGLPEGVPEPTFVIYSGGGYQAFWRLREPIVINGNIEKAEEVELYNKQLELIFGGDNCHNVDRIMRLPGTINRPDAKKLAKGRKEAMAKLVINNTSKSWALSRFTKAARTTEDMGNNVNPMGVALDFGDNIPGEVPRLESADDLRKKLVAGPQQTRSDVEWEDKIAKTCRVLVQGTDEDVTGPKEGDNSRSSWLFEFLCTLVKANLSDLEVYGIITDPKWGIADSVIKGRDGKPKSHASVEKYAKRQIKNAKEAAIDPNLYEMNSRFAVIEDYYGKVRVVSESYDASFDRMELRDYSLGDITTMFENRTVVIERDENGNPTKRMPMGKWWRMHPMRRQYQSIGFNPELDDPRVYNLWKGFAVESIPGKEKWSIYHDHMLNNICGGNEAYYEYLIKWMAYGVQNPASQGHVAVVLRGGKGTGKSVFARHYMKLFGSHALTVANSSHLVGNFNSHLRNTCVVFADEAFYAHDKKHKSVLKTLITEPELVLEAKGKDAIQAPNCVKLIMASNDEHVVQASGIERRFFVLDVSNAHQKDSAYFRDMEKQMMAGGYEALLFDLLNLNLSGFDIRNCPETEALQDQKQKSLNLEEKWWVDKLETGYILPGVEWIGGTEVVVESLINNWVYFAKTNSFVIERTHSVSTSVGALISGWTDGGLTARQSRVKQVQMFTENGELVDKNYYGTRVRIYRLPPIEEARAAWERKYGKRSWEISEEEIEDIPF